ncbi:hypothetical protein VTP01DRAFT_7396 [Rhizomucor pusillus]|uniref:uncharacterized protein n=1 Tax=Rhizomucor pusillus TaxID=4840 RepID=UPI003741F353
MTLYYSIVFLILLIEILLFLLLMVPFPNKWRISVFRFLATDPLMGHVRYILKIVFVFIFVLFLDSVNRLQTISVAAVSSASGDMDVNTVVGAQAVQDARADANYSAKKFYAQRNMYLTGSTLFLFLILRHTYHLTVDLIQLEDENARLQGMTAVVDSSPAASSSEKKKDE